MTIFLVGGAPADSLDSVHDQFVASAKKRGTRVAVALLGTQEENGDSLPDYTEPITSRWPEAEIVPVWLDDDLTDGENATRWPDSPLELAGLVVAGGLTPGYLDALLPHRALVAKLVRTGTPYLGYSAGAMVVSQRAVVGGWKFRGRQMVPDIWGEGLEELELRDGLGLIGPSIDVHSDVMGLGRAMAAIEKGEASSVVAIDEGTCLVIDPVSGRTVVEGSQRIHWLAAEGGATVVRHESSAAEMRRHEGFLPAEQAAAERQEAERRAEQERAAERRRAEEQHRREKQEAEKAERAAQVAAERRRLEAEQAEREARRAERDQQRDERRAQQQAEREAERAAALEAADRLAAEQAELEQEEPYPTLEPEPEAETPEPVATESVGDDHPTDPSSPDEAGDSPRQG